MYHILILCQKKLKMEKSGIFIKETKSKIQYILKLERNILSNTIIRKKIKIYYIEELIS